MVMFTSELHREKADELAWDAVTLLYDLHMAAGSCDYTRVNHIAQQGRRVVEEWIKLVRERNAVDEAG